MTTATATIPAPPAHSGSLFQQAYEEVAESLDSVLAAHPAWQAARVLERLAEPDRIIRFRVTWTDDKGAIHINRGWRVQQTNLLGPYKGGLRFHPSVTEDTLRFLAWEQAFKNALTGLPLGAGKGGSDFDPKGKSDAEVNRFCNAFMAELQPQIGPDRDVPAGDIGVGGREVGYLYGAYMRLTREHGGVLTGKPLGIGGVALRTEATGYGTVAFARHMLEHKGESLDGKKVAISGSGNVALYAAERCKQQGAKVLTLSDSGGTIVCEAGLSQDQIDELKNYKEVQRGRLSDYSSPGVEYHHQIDPWGVACEVALPCATQNELDGSEAASLIANGVIAVAEGANMPCTPDAVEKFAEAGVAFGPGKAANAGGVGTSGFEMSQNSLRIPWTRSDTEQRLETMMANIHASCVEHGGGKGKAVDYVRGANIAGFTKLAEAMMQMGV